MARRHTVLTHAMPCYAADTNPPTYTPAGVIRLRLYNDGSTHVATSTVSNATAIVGQPQFTALTLQHGQARTTRCCIVATEAWSAWLRLVAAAGAVAERPRVVLRRATLARTRSARE